MKAIIVGAGSFGKSLLKILLENKWEVCVIEKDEEIAKNVREEFGVNVVAGDATNIDLLEEAGIKDVNVVIAATSREDTNAFVGIIAKQYNVPRVIVRISDRKLESFLKKVGVEELFNVEETAAINLFEQIVSEEIQKSVKLDEHNRIIVVKASKLLNVIGKPIEKIRNNEIRCVALIKKDGKLFFEKAIVEENDLLILISRLDTQKSVEKLK